MTFKHWFLATRPKTLTAALVPLIGSSALVIATNGPHHAWIFYCALLASLAIQIATNFFNDAIDFKKGADDESRLGPKRMTATGVFSYKKMVIAGSVMLIIAVLFGAPLVYHGGLPILLIGLASIFLAYAYTGGPFPLAYKGLGEVFVILFFGIIPMMGMVYLHQGQWSLHALVAGIQFGLLSAVLIAINNLRDRTTDLKVGKKTIAVRFGEKNAKIVISFFVALPFVINIYWLTRGFGKAAVLPLLVSPLAIILVKQVWATKPSAIYNKFLALSSLLYLSFALLMSIGFLGFNFF